VALDATPDTYSVICGGGSGVGRITVDGVDAGSMYRTCNIAAPAYPGLFGGLGSILGPKGAAAGLTFGLGAAATAPVWCLAPAFISGVEVVDE
jgi:hypothetical protein